MSKIDIKNSYIRNDNGLLREAMYDEGTKDIEL